MTSYTVTIAPDDPDLATTMIRLDVTTAAATIRELRLSPGSSGGLTPGQLPVLDMNQLVAAVIAAVVPRSATAETKPSPTTQAAPVATTTPLKATRQRTPRNSELTDVASPAKKATVKPSTAKATKAAAGKVPAGKAAKAGKKTVAGKADAGGRTYRRIPDDFDQILRQSGESASIIADHYDVPRHTAYGWIRSARKRSAAAS